MQGLLQKRCIDKAWLLVCILPIIFGCQSRDGANVPTSSEPGIVRDASLQMWLADNGGKIWTDRRFRAGERSRPLVQMAANEWEAFQIVVDATGLVDDLSITVGELQGPNGATLASPTLYRQHFLPIPETQNRQYGHTGLVPDALVPFTHPLTGKPTGGRYGGNSFELNANEREAFWAEFKTPANQLPGIYKGSVIATARGMEPLTLPLTVEVFGFSLPAKKALTACFQMAGETLRHSHSQLRQQPLAETKKLARVYEAMLHEHSINNWSPVLGYDYSRGDLKIKISGKELEVDWSAYDALVEPYMNGSAYADGVPAQCLFAPYFMPVKRQNSEEWAPKINRHNYHRIDHELLGKWVVELEKHFREKGWLDRTWLFYFDEPFLQGWKYQAFKSSAATIKKHAPNLRIMLTDSYRPDRWAEQGVKADEVLPYVDSWNPVTWQVTNLELAKFYQQRKRDGKFDFWCQTLANANSRRGVINLFPEFDMPFHRMWGVMSWRFGFSGIEWWGTTFWYNYITEQRTDPWKDATAFPLANKPLNGDGRFFYPGTPDAIGGPDIPIASLRMKAVRDAIEDYEYLQMAENAGIKLELDELHTWNKKSKRRMKQPMPMGQGPWHWWEGDADRFSEFRQDLARKLEAARE